MCHFLFLPASCHTPLLRGGGGGHACVCQAWRYPGRSHCSRVSRYRVCPCGRTDPRVEGARSREGPWRASLSLSLPPPTGCKRKRREGRASASAPEPHLGGLCPWAPVSHPCVCVQLRVLCPCVCARVSKRESERDFEPSRPSTEIRTPPKQETGVFLPPLHPSPASLPSVLPAASHPRQILKSRRQN